MSIRAAEVRRFLPQIRPSGLIRQDYIQGGWQNRCVDLSPYAGDTFGGMQFLRDVTSPAGDFTLLFSDVTYLPKNGAPLSLTASLANGTYYQGSNPGTDSSLLAVVEDAPGAAPPKYYLDDHLGTAQMELSAGGWPVWQGTFTPFGQEIVGSSAYRFFGQQPGDGTDNHYKFTGKERDTESGLDYFGARYYGSSMGRWMSPDYNEDPQPIPFAQLSNPQTLNLYAYVVNNPLSMVDADGHTTPCPGGSDMGGGKIVIAARPCYNDDPTKDTGGRPPLPPNADGRITPGDLGLSWYVGGKLGGLLGEGALGLLDRLLGRTGGEALGQVLSKLTPAEKAFVEELEKAGHKVTPIARGAGQTADFLVDGVEMELKTVTANGPNSIKNAIETASSQTARGQIVIDARGSAATAEAATSQIHRAAGNVGASALRGRVSVMTKSGTVKF